MPGMSPPPPARTKGVQSVDTAARLLRILMESGQPMMLRDIADQAGLKSAQAHAYLNSLRRARLVQQAGTAGRYALAEETLALSHAALALQPGYRPAVAAARALSERSGRMSTVDLWISGAPVTVFVTRGVQMLNLSVREGQRNDISNSAAAWVFAAFDPERAAALGAAADACARIRDCGFALVDRVPVPHLSSLALPVFAGGRLAAVLSLTGFPAEIAEGPETVLAALRRDLAGTADD